MAKAIIARNKFPEELHEALREYSELIPTGLKLTMIVPNTGFVSLQAEYNHKNTEHLCWMANFQDFYEERGQYELSIHEKQDNQ